MEIRPYRSQVRATPTPEPTERPNTARGQAYISYGDAITKTGQTVANSMYQWDDAIEKRRDQDDKVEFMAFQQQVLEGFDKVNIDLKSYFDELAKDPYKVFDYDAKDAANKIYTNEIDNLRHSTLDNIKNPRIRQQAELYFRELKMKTGAATVAEIEQNRNKAASFVYGKSIGLHIDNAVNGDEEVKNDETVSILKDLRSMVEMGIMGEAELDEKYKAAKDQINYRRAENQVDALLDADQYAAAQEFIDKVPDKDFDDKMRKALDDHLKDRMDRKKSIIQQQQGETYNEGLDLYDKDQLSKEWIAGKRDVFKIYPELGITQDLGKILEGLLDKKEEHDKLERQVNRIDYYFQQMFNPDAEYYGKGDDIKTMVINDKDLTTPQKESILKGLSGGAKGSKSGSDAELAWGEDNYIYHMDEYWQILNSEMGVTPQKMKLFGEFCDRYYVPPEKLGGLRSGLEHAYVDPRLDTLVTMLDGGMQNAKNKKDYAKWKQYNNIANSLYEAIFTDTSSPDGKPLNDAERQRKIDFAIETADKFIKGMELDDLDKKQYLPNKPVIEAKYPNNTRDYDISIGEDFDVVRSNAERASLLRYTKEGRNLFDQYITAFNEMIDKAEGTHVEIGNPIFIGDEVRFESGIHYYKDEEGKTRRYVNKIYTIFKNGNGNTNISETVHDGKGEKTSIVIPYLIKRQWDVDEAEIAEFAAYQEDVQGKQNRGIDVDLANKAYESAEDKETLPGMTKVEYERRNRKADQ